MKHALPSAVLAASLLLALPLKLSAQQALPKAIAGEVITMTAKVVAVDQTARLITLEGSDGVTRTIEIGPQVKNLAQVKPGDRIKATYMQAVALELKKGGSGIRGSTVKESASGAKLGEKPSGVAQRQVTLTGTVEQVDKAKKLVTVKGPKGNVVDVVVSETTLDTVKVGDQVDLVYTEAMAVAVSAGDK